MSGVFETSADVDTDQKDDYVRTYQTGDLYPGYPVISGRTLWRGVYRPTLREVRMLKLEVKTLRGDEKC